MKEKLGERITMRSYVKFGYRKGAERTHGFIDLEGEK